MANQLPPDGKSELKLNTLSDFWLSNFLKVGVSHRSVWNLGEPAKEKVLS